MLPVKLTFVQESIILGTALIVRTLMEWNKLQWCGSIPWFFMIGYLLEHYVSLPIFEVWTITNTILKSWICNFLPTQAIGWRLFNNRGFIMYRLWKQSSLGYCLLSKLTSSQVFVESARGVIWPLVFKWFFKADRSKSSMWRHLLN